MQGFFIIDRQVPRKPRLVGGVKGHNLKWSFLSGKPRPVVGELHQESIFLASLEIEHPL